MSWRDRVAQWIGGPQTKAALSDSTGSIATVMSLMRRGSPPSRGTKELISAYKEAPWVRSVTHRIAGSVAAVPFRAYAARGRGGRAYKHRSLRQMDPEKRRRLMRQMKQDGELQELEGHPISDFIEFGNMLAGVRTPGVSVRHVAQVHMDLKGESFLAVERDDKGLPKQKWALPPHWVTQTPTPHDPMFKVRLGSESHDFAPEQVYWMRDPDPVNPFGRGTGFGESLGDEIDSDEYAAEMIKAFFYNRAIPDAIVSAEDSSEEEVDRLKQRWEENHRGWRRANMVHFTNAKMAVQLLSRTFKELELKDLREFYRNTLHQVFGVPPEVLGIIENSNRATIDAAAFMFAKWVIVPRLAYWLQFYQWVADSMDDRILIDYDSPVPEDREFKLKAMQAAPYNFTRQQWQEMAGFDGHGDVDEVYIQNLSHIERPVDGPDPVPIMPGDEGKRKELGDGGAAHGKAGGQAPRLLSAPGVLTKAGDLMPEHVDNIMRSLVPERLIDEAQPVWESELEAWGQQVLDEMGAGVSFNMLNPMVTSHLRTLAAERITGKIHETTRQNIRYALEEGVRGGEGVKEIATRVEDVFADADRRRARVIARTETVRSANFGTWQAHSVSGVVSEREWVTTRDGRERDAHADLDRQTRGIETPFAIDGATAMYPGDFGIGYLDVNCRCTTVFSDPDEKHTEEYLTAYWKRFVREVDPWEKRALAAFQRGFRRQLGDVLAALEEAARQAA